VVNHPITSDGVEIQETPELTGELVAIEIKTGKIEWRNEFEAAAFGAPTVVNDLVFMATFDGIVHAFDAETGGEVWQGTLPASSNAGLMASGDTLVVPAGLATQEGQQPQIVAYRVGGE
jgi:outer membrane protein assembly factor BamB